MKPPDSAATKLQVIIVDDHAEVREGLKSVINGQPDMEAVADATDGVNALRLVHQLAPDVVLVDISMPGWDGVTTTEKIKLACPQVKIIGVSRHGELSIVRRMRDAGADGYVLKRNAVAELPRAIRTVARGGRHIDGYGAGERVVASGDAGLRGKAALERQEEHVLRLVASCQSNQDIAARLAIGINDVIDVKARAMEKAGLHSRIQVLAYVRARGWVESS